MSNKANWVVLSGYKRQLRHYYKIGIGERSKIAGSIVTDKLIDVVQNRYLALGGKMKDLDEVDAEFDESE